MKTKALSNNSQRNWHKWNKKVKFIQHSTGMFGFWTCGFIVGKEYDCSFKNGMVYVTDENGTQFNILDKGKIINQFNVNKP